MSDGYYFCKTCNRFYDVGSFRFIFLHSSKHDRYYRSVNSCPADQVHDHNYINCGIKYARGQGMKKSDDKAVKS